MIEHSGRAQNIKHKENKNKSLPEMYKKKVTRKCQTLKYLFFILSIDVKYWNKFSALLILKSRWTLLRMQIEKNYKNTLPFQHHLPPILNYAHQLHSNNVGKKTVSNHSSEQSCGILPDHKSFRNPLLQMPSILLLWSTPKTIYLQILHSFVQHVFIGFTASTLPRSNLLSYPPNFIFLFISLTLGDSCVEPKYSQMGGRLLIDLSEPRLRKGLSIFQQQKTYKQQHIYSLILCSVSMLGVDLAQAFQALCMLLNLL